MGVIKAGNQKTLIPSASRTIAFTGAAVHLDEQAVAVEIVVDLTAIAGTSPTIQVYVEPSYDGGATWDTRVAVGQAEVAADRSRFVFPFKEPPLGLTVVGDSAGYFQDDIDTAPAAGIARWHIKPNSYRAVTVLGGTVTSYTVGVTLREVLEGEGK